MESCYSNKEPQFALKLIPCTYNPMLVFRHTALGIPRERRLAFSAFFPPCVAHPPGTVVWLGKHMSSGPACVF